MNADERDTREELKILIQKDVIVRNTPEQPIIGKYGGENNWLLDFRAVLLQERFLTLAAKAFWEKHKHLYPFQVGGLETAAIALVAAIVLHGAGEGMPVNGFYIRKSRKHFGLQKNVEGTLNEHPIILVDDLVHSGASFEQQIATLKEVGRDVSSLFAFVRYQEKYVFEEKLSLITLFTPQDFGLSFKPKRTPPKTDAFSLRWAVRAPKPNFFYRIPKSAPIIDKEKVYFGSDDGVMHACDQASGEELWSFCIQGRGEKGKTIFSSPSIHKDTLFFGAYDGNFYALDTQSGEKKWVYSDADWIGSSPTVAPSLGLVFVGLEYGLWKKQGGIVALDTQKGEKRWEYIDMPKHTHGSPVYSEKYDTVAIGSNDGVLYVFRAADGALLWQFQSGAEIRSAPTFVEERGYIIFGSFDGKVYIVDVVTGSLVYSYETEASIYSQPLVWSGRLYVSSLDKKIYCISLDTFEVVWTYTTQGRVFASPAIAENLLYVGSNDGCLYELDPDTGYTQAFFQTTERITNKVAYNEVTRRFFLLTYANELFCLEKK